VRGKHSSELKMERPPGTHPQPRPRRKVDWELVACGWAGHALVGTDAAELRPQDELYAREYGSIRWLRCLRCDSWIALAPPEHPARRYPPDRDSIQIPRRGKALRDRLLLRVIAIDRLIHFIILTTLGIAVLAIAGNADALRGRFYRVLADLQNGVAGGAVQNSRHAGFFHELDKLLSLRAGTLRELGIALLAYGLIEGLEAVGLWLTKRWAEYLTFIATTVLLPLEIYEIIHGATVLKVIGFLINVAVVVYLLLAKRLFGLRGGGAADERERAQDMTWDALDAATPPVATPSHP
jgi:uncharacterized membrane protein (DUF2068 family)